MGLSSVFSPHSIAIIGASSQPGKVGNDLVKNLVEQGYKGKIFPVNPKGGELYGLPMFSSVHAVGEPIELAIIAVPAEFVVSVASEALKAKAQALIVVSAGFAESGNQKAQQQLVDLAKKAKVPLIGPNCLGVMNTHLSLNATFAPTLPAKGNIAFVSQSGALATALLDSAAGFGLGFSKIISLGNKASTDELSVLPYLLRDKETDVILLYAEEIGRLPEFLRYAREHRHEWRKPIIVLKAGATAAGSQAARSHTGALAGSQAAYGALFAQSGLIHAESIEEFFSLASIFAQKQKFVGQSVAVVTNAGGPGVLTADAVSLDGLQLAQLREGTKKQLQAALPPAASLQNPIDLLGDASAERYRQVLQVLSGAEEVGAIVVVLTPQASTEIQQTAKEIANIRRNTKKPIVAVFLGDDKVEAGREILEDGHVSAIPYPETAVSGLALLSGWSFWRRESPSELFTFHDFRRAPLERLLKRKGWLSDDQALEVLRALRLPVPRYAVVHSSAQAEKVLRSWRKPGVLKILSPDILHKSDVGGVITGVMPETVGESYAQLLANVRKHQPRAALRGALLVEQVTGGKLEVILGAVRDPQAGPIIACGLGGIYAEVLKDVSFGIAPLTHRDTQHMLDRLRSHPIFAGVRGQPALDTPALKECLGRLSQFMLRYPQVQELDINPLILLPKGQGACAVDVRIRVG